METIGKRIKYAREKRNISQTKLAKAIGKDVSTLYRYENDLINKFPSNIILKLSKILDVSVDYLLGYEESNLNEVQKKINEIDFRSYRKPKYEHSIHIFLRTEPVLTNEDKERIERSIKESLKELGYE